MLISTRTKADETLEKTIDRYEREIEQYEKQINTQIGNMYALIIMAFLIGIGIGMLAINYLNCYVP